MQISTQIDVNDDKVSEFLIKSHHENQIVKLDDLVELIRKEYFPFYSKPDHPSEEIKKTKKTKKPNYLPFGTVLTKDNFIPGVWCHVSDSPINGLSSDELKRVHKSKIIKIIDGIFSFKSETGITWKYAMVAHSTKDDPQPWGDYKPYRWFRHKSTKSRIGRLVSDTFMRNGDRPSSGMFLFDFGKSFSGHDGYIKSHNYELSEEAEALRVAGSGHLHFALKNEYEEIEEPSDISNWNY